MSELSTAPAKALRQAMCLECGAVRVAKAQYLGRGSRRLRCLACGHTTLHAAVNWDGVDEREEANRIQTRGTVHTLEELDALIELFHGCNIEVLVADASDSSREAEPLGGLVDVVRWLDSGTYQVRLQADLKMVDRVYCLDWAWKSIRPNVARWHRCPLEIDADGELYQRIYNNGIELGLYRLS